MSEKMGILVDLDFCVGCYACQSACNLHWNLPVGESYLQVLRCDPERVDGELRLFMCPIPYKLDKCAECIAMSDDGEAPCTQICIGKALTVGAVDAVREKSASLGRPTALFA